MYSLDLRHDDPMIRPNHLLFLRSDDIIRLLEQNGQLLNISLDLMKSLEVRKAGDRSIYCNIFFILGLAKLAETKLLNGKDICPNLVKLFLRKSTNQN